MEEREDGAEWHGMSAVSAAALLPSSVHGIQSPDVMVLCSHHDANARRPSTRPHTSCCLCVGKCQNPEFVICVEARHFEFPAGNFFQDFLEI